MPCISIRDASVPMHTYKSGYVAMFGMHSAEKDAHLALIICMTQVWIVYQG